MHKNFDFQDEEKSNLQDQIFKEAIFEDTFRLLLSNKSSISSFIKALRNIYGSTVNKVAHCLFAGEKGLGSNESTSLSM